ncbi:hypothetical protein E6O75_ATG10425 [Venturia nashicola]|uniref:Secreted protein n=1 Tax=Venturia nashicola TaxID=86259 RepID=A0A4Z1NPQ5_9PEZI|nr:hypothetical protein E6O75_ATG10425 [Venturia nashicola]
MADELACGWCWWWWWWWWWCGGVGGGGVGGGGVGGGVAVVAVVAGVVVVAAPSSSYCVQYCVRYLWVQGLIVKPPLGSSETPPSTSGYHNGPRDNRQPGLRGTARSQGQLGLRDSWVSGTAGSQGQLGLRGTSRSQKQRVPGREDRLHLEEPGDQTGTSAKISAT